MVALVLLLGLLVQEPRVTARVDRDRVVVGDDVVLTITVEASGADPVEIVEPELVGLEFRDLREQSRMRIVSGTQVRTTTRTLTLRALRPGAATIGAVSVQQGGVEVATAPIRIQVTAPAAATGALDPGVTRLLERAPAPDVEGEDVALTVLTSPETALVGTQVDVVVAAWVPREVRTRLRTPPTLEGPAVRGGWIYHRPAPTGIALTRTVRGRAYDLFVLHEVVFPLVAGALEIGPAKVTYTVPLSYAFLSRELLQEVQSAPRTLAVAGRPAPPPGAPYTGATAAALELVVEAPAGELPVGGAAEIRAILTGTGNVALWPEPAFAWPAGLRVYPQEVNVEVAVQDGRIGGSKVFRYLVVPDSAGTHRVPPARYVYFDVDRGAYRELRTAGLEFVTPVGSGRAVTVAAAPRALLVAARGSAAQWLRAPSAWVWLLIVLLPPAVAGVRPLARRGRRARPRVPARRDTLADLERDFRAVLARLVPSAAHRDGDGLVHALRAAGVDAAVAAHAARLRDRLRRALFGRGGAADSAELRMEVRAVLGALEGHGRSGHARRAALAGLVAVLAVVPSDARAQAAERLYQTGAARAAADSFAARAAAEPLVAAHWYNLGSALERLGEPVRAQAAWLEAARLAPRAGAIRGALGRSAGLRARSALDFVAPVTPAEAWLAAAALWVLGWLAVALRARPRVTLPILALALTLAGFGGYVALRYRTPAALVLEGGTPLRAAPYGTAPAGRALERGVPVRIERAWGAWYYVSAGAARGWIGRSEVVPVQPVARL